MVINLLLGCVVMTLNEMKRIFFKSKWTSWHCHVKKKLIQPRVAPAASEQELKFQDIRHRVWITLLESVCKKIVPPVFEHHDVIERQTRICMHSRIVHATTLKLQLETQVWSMQIQDGTAAGRVIWLMCPGRLRHRKRKQNWKMHALISIASLQCLRKVILPLSIHKKLRW